LWEVLVEDVLNDKEDSDNGQEDIVTDGKDDEKIKEDDDERIEEDTS
jgi:hypothetical protein